MTAPLGGFNHPAIWTMFNPPSPSPDPSTHPQTISPRPNHSKAGTIAGAVVGAVAGLALIVGLVAWAMRSRRKRTAMRHHELHGESALEEKDTEYKCQELPADVTPIELSDDARPLQQQEEAAVIGAPTNPAELPADRLLQSKS